MKIVVLGTRGFPNVQGGVEVHCEHLYPLITQLKNEVIVFTRKPYIHDNDFVYKNVRLVNVPTVHQVAAEAFLHTFLGIFYALKHKPDIIHFQSIGPSLFVPLAKLLGFKVVMTTHGPNYKHLKWGKAAKMILRLGEYLGVKFSDQVIAISNSIAEDIEKQYKRKVNVIPNGVIVHPQTTSDSLLNRYNLSGKKYILAVGRLIPDKGFHDLVEAYESICRENSFFREHYKLVIVGDSDHKDKFSENLKSKGRDNIMFIGFQNNEALRELYSNARLFVLPSYNEGLPIVLLEAMSFGLSCIVSDIPANRNVELSEDRHFKAGDVHGLSKKIKKYIDIEFSDDDSREQIEKIRQNYDWQNIAEKTVEVYQKSLNRGKKEMQLV